MEENPTPVTNSEAAEAKAAATNSMDSPKSKEEGEISSSDDDDFPAAEPASQFAGDDTALSESAQASPVNTTLPDNKTEQCDPAVKSACMVDVSSGTAQQSDRLRVSEKNRGPFVPFVISFSDDDTGSDSDHSRRNTKDSKQGVDRRRIPPVSSVLKSQKSQQNTTRKARLIHRELSLSRPYVSSLTKINGAISRNNGQLSRNFGTLQRGTSQSHGPGRKTNTHLNANKRELQDLRQLIAIRESQLKLKLTQQTKKSVAGTSRDVKIRKPSNSGNRVWKASEFDMQSGLKEPDKKRLKTGEQQSSQLGSDCHNNLRPLPMSTLGKSRLDDCNKESVVDHSHCGKGVPLGTSLSIHCGLQEQAEAHDSLFSANPPNVANEGNNAVANSSQNARYAKSAGPMLKQTGQTEKRAIGDFPRKSGNVELDHMEYTCQDVPISVQNQVRAGSNLTERDGNQVKPSAKVSEQVSVDKVQASPFHVLYGNLEKAPLSNTNFMTGLDKTNMTGNSSMDLQSLLDFEELLDKEIEEAQEHRRKCEIEERNALMAYRKAQRALIEANARCTNLYSKRELYSAQLRSLMMENPNHFFSLRRHDQIDAGLNSCNNVSDVDVHLIPTYSYKVQTASDVNKVHGCDTIVPSANDGFESLSDLHASRQDLVPGPCCEPDRSPSEGHKQPVSNGICSPSGYLSQSSYEDGEIFVFDHKSAQYNLESERTPEFIGAREKDIYEESERQVPPDGSQDSLLLEASLRSQLFEKLKKKKLSKVSQGMEHLVERRAEDDVIGKMMETDAENVQVSQTENDKHLDFEDRSKEDRHPELAVQIKSQFDISHPEHASTSADVLMDTYFPLEGQQSKTFGNLFLPGMKIAFSHLRALELPGVLRSGTMSSDVLISDVDQEIEDSFVLSKSKRILWSLDTTETTAMDLFVGQSGYYSCDLAIDPSWPLCMYELRGKCNNDECPWQHVKDYSCDSMKLDATDVQLRKQSHKGQFYGAMLLRKSPDHLVLAPPIYSVGLDILRIDSQSCISASPLGYGQCWGKCFTASLVLSSLCPTVTQSNEPFLHGTEARIEVHSSWNGQSSYFHRRSGTLNQLNQCAADVDQSVEMALLSFTQEADKNKARIEALKVLVQAIEDNPTSTVLWIIYLLIFYSNQKSIGGDDLFQYAVENNKECYELWLLYINSRIQLHDRLGAYDMALFALSHLSSTSDGDWHTSQCILDLVLQKMNCLCMSGNVGRAIEKISGLFLLTEKSDNYLQLSLPDIVACLTICDKFIFWVCCVYLLVYKKLPDLVVQRFEYVKESYAIEWPSICLSSEEKQQAASLLEMAVDSLASFMDHESLENEKTLRAAHLFALNHVRCVSVLEGLECSRSLLEKYITLYPSCLELVLASAQEEYALGSWSCRGFEEALRNWPDQVPGVNCIWNQYVGCILQNGNLDLVQELLDRWFCSALQARDSDDGVLQTNDRSSDSSLQSISVPELHAWFSSCDQNDGVFGMLNLSLYKLLQNNWADARVALDLALKAATADNYQHCLRELIPLLLIESIQHKGNVHLKGILNILNVHLVDMRASLASSEPLSRDFIQKIKKPRIRQLVSKLLSPDSADFSMMNMVLEVWHDRTLLPHFCDKQMDLVNFVEAIMEILPSNYLLALSVCKLLSESDNVKKFSANISFWASSMLVNSLFHAVPVAPEYAWVEAADILHNLTVFRSIKESFHKKALLVYPFSIKLWKSYLHIFKTEGEVKSVKEAAKEKGIELD